MTHREPALSAALAELDRPQFTRLDVLSMTGRTEGQTKGILDRKIIETTTLNPGSGRQALFSPSAVIKLEAAHAMIDVGIPVRNIADLAEWIDRRAREFCELTAVTGGELDALADDKLAAALPTDFKRNVWWLMFPLAERDGKWQAAVFDATKTFNPRDWPLSYCVIQVDELILQTFAKFNAFFARRPMPRRAAVDAYLDVVGDDYVPMGRGRRTVEMPQDLEIRDGSLRREIAQRIADASGTKPRGKRKGEVT
jgi:hypothetical protein